MTDITAKKLAFHLTQIQAWKEVIAQTGKISGLLTPHLRKGKCSSATWRKVDAAIEKIHKAREMVRAARSTYA